MQLYCTDFNWGKIDGFIWTQLTLRQLEKGRKTVDDSPRSNRRMPPNKRTWPPRRLIIVRVVNWTHLRLGGRTLNVPTYIGPTHYFEVVAGGNSAVKVTITL